MTKTKYFKYGKQTCKAYYRTAGQGFEVGFMFGGTPAFVGNFIHAREANAWWTMMNKELRRFSKKYWGTPKAPMAFYCKFLSHYLYKCYYNYLDREFGKYQRNFTTGFRKHERKYTTMKKKWPTTTSTRWTFKIAA